MSKGGDEYIGDTLTFLKIMEDFKNKYFSAPLEKQRLINRLLFKTVLVSPKKRIDEFEQPLDFVWNEPFSSIVSWHEYKIEKDFEEQELAISKKWYPWPDSNRRHRD